MKAIHYRESGTGHPLLFLHGFCDNHSVWSEFVEPFAKSYRVVTPDLPGFGSSEPLASPFSIDQVADEIADWWGARKLGPCIVVGHSLGGYIALAIQARHPEMLKGLVLFHSTPNPDSEERKKIRNKVIAFVNENGVIPYIETFVPGLFADKKHPAIPETRRRCGQTSREALIGYALAMRERPDRKEVMTDATIPFLVLAGVKDSLIPLDDLKKLAEKAPKITLFELAETGHMGMIEAKKHAQNILSSYMREVWPINGT